MDTIKLPTGLATSLLEDKFRSLKGKSLTALTKQIIRATEDHIEDFLTYLDEPDKFATSDFAVGGLVLCNLTEIWSSTTLSHLKDNELVTTVDGVEYFSAKILDVDFLSQSWLSFQVEFPCDENKIERKFVSINSLRSEDLL
jgi:hypothetical protein